MALYSKAKGNVVSALAADVKLPKMAKVRQIMDHGHIPAEEIPGTTAEELERSGMRRSIRPGMTVAITSGSRGVANVAAVTKAIVDFVKDCGGEPFVFPAMGSHGGATAEGQMEILSGYGVTEEYLGCPVKASMEVDYLGDTPRGRKVYIDRFAHQADAIILCGRVKAHTAFRGPYESGIVKMAVIGMGKQHGAESVHQDGFIEMAELIVEYYDVIAEKANIIGAVALVENAFDETCRIAGLAADEILAKEPELLTYAKSRMGSIFFDNFDVLVVDKIGKDVSGDGMDPNVTGRYGPLHMNREKNIQHIAVLDLTDASHGNCCGIGLADVTTKRLVERTDVDITYPNVVTSTVLRMSNIPLFTHSDKSCIQIAVKTCNYYDRENPRIVRIRDTMHLEEIEISEAMLKEAAEMDNIEILTGPADWPFDENGNLW